MKQFTGRVNKINFMFSAVNQSPVTLWISLHLSHLNGSDTWKILYKGFDINFWKFKIFPNAEIDITVFINPIHYLVWKCIRDHFVYTSSQWEMMLQCNIVWVHSLDGHIKKNDPWWMKQYSDRSEMSEIWIWLRTHQQQSIPFLGSQCCNGESSDIFVLQRQ